MKKLSKAETRLNKNVNSQGTQLGVVSDKEFSDFVDYKEIVRPPKYLRYQTELGAKRKLARDDENTSNRVDFMMMRAAKD